MKQPTDVAQTKISTSSIGSKLNWVGMENIPLQLGLGTQAPTASSISAYVSLTASEQRGIHMSRIYELVSNQFGKSLEISDIKKLLSDMVSSQKGSSTSTRLIYKTKLMLKRKALKSDKSGYKNYPVQLKATLTPKGLSLLVAIQVEYSSTCPCSAALAREEIAGRFEEHFKKHKLSLEEGKDYLLDESLWPAWPHAQRSRATGHFQIDGQRKFPDLTAIIDNMERALKTPTQTGVKRIDEQEFARLNAQNLMFCEDAARRLKAEFKNFDVGDFKFRVRHLESLHSHDVFAESSKFF